MPPAGVFLTRRRAGFALCAAACRGRGVLMCRERVMGDDRGLLFDMDGLLLDTERVAMETFCKLVAPFGMESDVAGPLFLTMVGSSARQTTQTIAAHFPKLDIASFRGDWETAFLAEIANDVPLKSGVAETIARLAEAGRVMAVVTSTQTHHARMELERAGLLEAFVDVVGGDMVSANKPDPAPYLDGAALIGREPSSCVAFEDSDLGTTSAVRAGCTVWQIPDLRPADTPFPDLGQNFARSLPEAVAAAGLL